MKKILLIMLLTFTTMVASNEGEFEGRFVMEKMIKDDLSTRTNTHFTNSGVWIIDTKTGSIQGCVFRAWYELRKPSFEVFCSDWSKRHEDYALSTGN